MINTNPLFTGFQFYFLEIDAKSQHFDWNRFASKICVPRSKGFDPDSGMYISDLDVLRLSLNEEVRGYINFDCVHNLNSVTLKMAV